MKTFTQQPGSRSHIAAHLTRAVLLLAGLLCSDAAGQYNVVRQGDEDEISFSRTIVLPYAFSTEILGFGIGAVGTYGPESQPHSLYFGSAYVTDNGSWLGLLGAYDVQVPGVDRLFIRTYAIVARNTKMRVYVDGNPDFPDERAGSNESSADNYIEEDAYDVQWELQFRYVLPWGHFQDRAIHTYTTRNGVLSANPSGATSLNPFTSGKTTLALRPGYRHQFTQVGTGEPFETLNLELQLEHDNRDFVPNPNRGWLAKGSIKHDPGWVKYSSRWTTVEGELDGYIPLPGMKGVRQQTLALSAWGANTLSSSTAPYFAGPTLGGFYRLRGYPSNRFHDRAGLHYSVEYRVMPEWQPLPEINLLDPLRIRWWQLAALLEIGRVAPSWDLELLHRDMKVNYGIGLRGMFDKSIGRADFVRSDEGFSVVVMLGQAF